MSRIITFGEIMLRLGPEGYYRFVQADRFEVSYGGAEANVAVSLANFGIDTEFVTKLPDNEIGDAALNSLRRYGVKTEHVIRGGERIGIYFLEKGASQRPSLVIYDRNGSSIHKAIPDEFDWDRIFTGVEWFHFTGITPALGDNVANICLAACITAKAHGVTVSCDLNYRKKLWSKEKANQVMSKLAPYIDICMANEEDASDVFGIKAEKADATFCMVDYDSYEIVARHLAERYGFKQVAITLRTSISASNNKWAAMLFDGHKCYTSRIYDIHIVDRVGGGDSFGAGLIYANLMKYEPQQVIEFAVAASCLKHSIEGDFNMASVDEVLKLAEGDGSGRVCR